MKGWKCKFTMKDFPPFPIELIEDLHIDQPYRGYDYWFFQRHYNNEIWSILRAQAHIIPYYQSQQFELMYVRMHTLEYDVKREQLDTVKQLYEFFHFENRNKKRPRLATMKAKTIKNGIVA